MSEKFEARLLFMQTPAPGVWCPQFESWGTSYSHGTRGFGGQPVGCLCLVPSCPFASSLHLLRKCCHISKGQLLCFQVYNLLSEIHIQTSQGELFINAYDSGVFLMRQFLMSYFSLSPAKLGSRFSQAAKAVGPSLSVLFS